MTSFELWLCDGDRLPRKQQFDGGDLTAVLRQARTMLGRDQTLKMVEVHAGAEHLCSVGRGWISRKCSAPVLSAPDIGAQRERAANRQPELI